VRRKSIVLILTAALSFGLSAAAGEPALPRHPAPSPDGSLVAFCWQGDIWVGSCEGGGARRLTAHPGYDARPCWSRDGSKIAFSSDRHGNDDVFIVESTGGVPRRLTFHSSSDIPCGFSAGDDRVLFLSRRTLSPKWYGTFFFVPIRGGTPDLAFPSLGRAARISPDGGRIAYVRGGTRPWRRHYRGSANRDVWIHDLGTGKDVQVTRWDGDEDEPVWLDEHTLAYRSMEDGTKNIWVRDMKAGTARRITDHENSDVRSLQGSADGRWIAYEWKDGIYLLPMESPGSVRRIALDVPADAVHDETVRRTEHSGAGSMAVSPDGKQVAVVVRGELYATHLRTKERAEVAKPPTARILASPSMEDSPCWSPDGKWLLFTSDKDGRDALYRARPEGEAVTFSRSLRFEVEPVTREEQPASRGRYAPDGKKMAFIRGRGDLMVSDDDGGNPRMLVRCIEPPEFSWSPDSRWIAYSAPDLFYNHEVHIIPAEGGEPVNVSRSPTDDVGPAWSGDGRMLAWSSRRHNRNFDVWAVFLRLEDHVRSSEDWVLMWEEEDEGGKKGKGDEEKADSKEEGPAGSAPEVRIDFERIWERARPVTELPGDERDVLLSEDHQTLYFTAAPEGERDLYGIRWDGKDLKRLTEGGKEPRGLSWADGGKRLFYLTGKGAVASVKQDGKAGDPIHFSALYESTVTEERTQVFEQAWRALDLWFYDERFHGADWTAIRGAYRDLALSASTRRDFDEVVNWMLGELNSSHQAFYAPRDNGGVETGEIGVTFDPGRGAPGITVAEVLPDSPAAAPSVNLRPGERILSVNGIPVEAETNVYRLFEETVGRRTVLEVRSPEEAPARTVIVEPESVSGIRSLRYDQWVRERRAIVDRLSDGRIGYVHLRYMVEETLEDFMVDLHAVAHGKEGLIIDVRGNGGGWTTDWMLAILTVRRHAYTIPRGADPDTRAYPDAERLILPAWTKPAVTLCDEDSYSNAEIFSHAFRTLGRGPLVGNTTFGAVISTGSQSLLDGSRVRIPMRGWYNAAEGFNLEFQGAEPDEKVIRSPEEDLASDRDRQLEKGVAVLLGGLDGTPRERTW